LGAVLLEFWEVVKQAPDPTGSEEADDIVFAFVEDVLDVIADGPVHERRGETTVIVLQPVDDLIILLVLAAGVQELLVLFVFVDHVEHALVQSVRAIEYFPLAIEDELLQIEGYGLSDTEIFCVL